MSEMKPEVFVVALLRVAYDAVPTCVVYKHLGFVILRASPTLPPFFNSLQA